MYFCSFEVQTNLTDNSFLSMKNYIREANSSNPMMNKLQEITTLLFSLVLKQDNLYNLMSSDIRVKVKNYRSPEA